MTDDGPIQDDQDGDSKILSLGQIALDMVRTTDEGAEKYVIHPRGPEVIKAAVRVVLLSEEPPVQKAERFREVIALCHVLEANKGCPTAAQILADALFSDDRVAGILEEHRKQAVAKSMEYRKLWADDALRRAPKIDSKAPEDSVKLHSFLNPGQQRPQSSRSSVDRTSNFKVRIDAPSGAPRQNSRDPSKKKPEPRHPESPFPHGRKV